MIDVNQADLDYIRHLNDLIAGGLLHIADLRFKAYPGAIVYDDSGASKPMPSNKLERIFALIDSEERRVNRLIDKRYALKCQAIREIQEVIPPENMAARHVLYLRYLARDASGNNLGWSDVFRYVNKYHNISERHMHRLHHNGVSALTLHNI